MFCLISCYSHMSSLSLSESLRVQRNLRCTCPWDKYHGITTCPKFMSTHLRWIKLICAIIIYLSIKQVSGDSHLSNKVKTAFQIWHPFLIFLDQSMQWLCSGSVEQCGVLLSHSGIATWLSKCMHHEVIFKCMIFSQVPMAHHFFVITC